MSMNIHITCPHCGAVPGEGCSAYCKVNGKKVQALMKALHSLGLSPKYLLLAFKGYDET